jgi:Zn ribbon nucleic-acid-binding protein
MAGSQCPHCKQMTFFNEGPVSQCSKCGATGWGWNRAVNPGSGKGFECPNCERYTLHQVSNIGDKHALRRCSTCDYSLAVPFTPE